MPMQFIQDPDGPTGMGRVVDTDSGLDRMVYDPGLAEQLSAGAAPSPDQMSVIDNAASAPPPPAPVDPLAPAVPSLPTNPGQPPQVTQQAAEQWAARQAPPAPGPIVRASGAPPPPPAAPDGTVLTKAKVEPGQAGFTYDRAAEEQRGEETLDRVLEQQRRQEAVGLIQGEQQIELERQKVEAAKLQEREQANATRYERELESVVKKEINQDRLEENKGLFGSILGLVGQTLGYLSTPDSGFGRLQSSLDRRVQRDIDAQKEQKESTINMLTKRLGSAQQAENHYRAQVNATTADIIESRLKRLGVENDYADQVQGIRDQALAYNEAAKAASYGKAGAATYEFERPKPVGAGAKPVFKPGDSESQELEKVLGPKWEANYEKGMSAKVNPGENAVTVSQAIPMIAEMDNDLSTLDALAAANGGTIPTRGVINVPKPLRGALARMGYSDGMEAEQAGQLITGYVLRKARSYGGAVTAPDYENAEKEFGASGDGLRRGIKRMRDSANNGVRAQLATHFRGSGQKVLDITRRAYGGTQGSPAPEGDIPFGTTNAPEKPAAPAAAPSDPLRSMRKKGFSKSVLDLFPPDGSQAPGSAM